MHLLAIFIYSLKKKKYLDADKQEDIDTWKKHIVKQGNKK